MYSKEHGYISEPPSIRHLSYRQPARPRVQVPPNYSGHAIVDGEACPLGGMDTPEPPEESASSEGPVPRFDDLPRVSELGESRYRLSSLPLPSSPLSSDEGETEITACTDPHPQNSGEDTPLPISTPPPAERGGGQRFPSLFSLSRFPFGHGIGWEELFILGLIWLLLHENPTDGRDRGDLDETVILLGLLLLLG